MKRKTATFVVYTPFLGRGRMLNIMYRGKCLTSFGGVSASGLIAAATIWADNQGFTATKVVTLKD